MKFVGEVEIIKQFDNGYCQVVHQSTNAIAEGLGYGLTNLFSLYGSKDLEDYNISYFQAGVGNLSSNFPTAYTNKSFHTLASALQASDYGNDSIQEISVLDHIVSVEGNFIYPPTYTTTSAAFVEVDSLNKSIVNQTGFSSRLVLDKTMANGKNISEIGLFMDNPDGYPNKKQPILVAYKSFEPIQKSSDFDLIILWRISVKDIENNNLGFLGPNTKKFYFFEFASGVGDIQTGTYQGDFAELGIPATYDYEGAPLVVTFHSLGSNQNQWRNNSSYRVGGLGPSSLYNNVLDRGCFYLGVHGVVGSSGFFGTDGSSLTAAQLTTYQGTAKYSHGNDIRRNWNSKQAFDGFYKILQYIVNHYPIDKRRIYFFGFSMGGGCATSYASRMIDGSPSGLHPAGVVALAPALNIKKVWHSGAPSSIGASIYWPQPVNSALRDFAEPVVYWTAGSGNPSAISNYTGGTGAGDGPLWSTVSALTPSDVPLAYYENLSVDYNLVTSSNFSFSTCTFYNLRHIPYYFQYSNDDTVGGGVGGFLEEPNRNLASALVFSGIHSNYKFVYSSLADVSSMMVNQYGVNPALSMETHNLYALNQNDAINFLFSSTYSPPLEASTIVTRSGKAWYFDVKMLADHTNNYYSNSYANSGLGVIVWKIDNTDNTLWVSGYNDMIVAAPNSNAPLFDWTLTEFNPAFDKPFKLYNLSSNSCYPLTSGSTRRIKIKPFNTIPRKVIFKPYIDGNGTLDPVGEEMRLMNGNTSYRTYGNISSPYAAANQKAQLDMANKTFIALTVGYYEIHW